MKKATRARGGDAYPDGGATVFSVREAKAHLSALVGRAARGEEITITWHGQCRAKLTPIPPAIGVLRIDRAWLKSQPSAASGARSEDLVRSERDSRG